MSGTTKVEEAVTEAPWDRRVSELLSTMTLVEKVGQLNLVGNPEPDRHRSVIADGTVGAAVYSHGPYRPNGQRNPELAALTAECQRVATEESRLGIPMLLCSDITHGLRTVFPIPLGLATSWDPELIADCAAQVGAEARAAGVALTFAPMVDIASEFRWGRVGETFGDDPVIASRFGAAMVRGLQRTGRVAAAVKHFCGYGLVQAERDHETLPVGPTALHNVHLRPFRAAVDAGCRAIMVGVHDIDGVPMHACDDLVRGVLKGDWGFTGVVISDWAGIEQLVHSGVAIDRRDAARLAMLAGIDLDMASGVYAEHLAELVESGEVEVALVDDAVRRVLRLKFELGLFDGAQPTIGSAADHDGDDQLARTTAASSMVLVKNANNILPLHGNLGRVHLCGPFASDTDALLGTWVFDDAAPGATLAADLAARIDTDDLLITEGGFADLALQHALAADLTVAIVGEHPIRGGEDRCLPNADLPAGQLELVRSLADTGKPLVVVVVAGRPLELQPVLESADAVILAWHPGGQAGPAIADVLTGAVSPSGRLPIPLPRVALQGTMERTTGRRLGRSQDNKFGRYLNALAHPELSLGYGLTYTRFAYSEIELSRERLAMRGGVVRATVEIANTGTRPGREVVQLYISDLVADIVRPLIELSDWQVVDLEPGRTERVSFKITSEQFGYWGRGQRWCVDPGAVDVIIGPNAARGSSARLEITT